MADNKREYLDKTGLDHLVEGLNNKFVNAAGDTMTGALAFKFTETSEWVGTAPGIKWYGGSDGAQLTYRCLAKDKGEVNLNFTDDSDPIMSYSWNGTVKHKIGQEASSFTGSVTADSLIKSGSDNNHVLLGGGGDKKLADHKPFDTIAWIRSDGVSELGRYVDFHYDNTTNSDYSTRFEVTGNNNNIIKLPTKSGTLARLEDIPTIPDIPPSPEEYHWANLPITKEAKTDTEPQFKNITTTLLIGGPRIASLDIPHANTSCASMRLDSTYSGTTKTGYPGSDGRVLTFFWDNSGTYDTQLHIPDNSNNRLKLRSSNGKWGNWKEIAYLEDVNSINPSGKYLPLSGGTMTGPISGGSLDTHPENNGILLAYYVNDLANLLKRGGKVTVRNITRNKDISLSGASNMFDASPTYYSFSVDAKTDIVEINIVSPKTYYWGTQFGIGSGASTWRAKNVKYEVGYTVDGKDHWKTVIDVKDSNRSIQHVSSSGPRTADSCPWNKIKITLTNFNEIHPRIAQIWSVNYGSRGLKNGFLGTDGGTVYGDITAERFIKKDGKSTEILMADGSVKMVTEVGNNYDDTKCFYKDGTRAATDDFNMGNHNIKNLAKNGGIYWNPCMETDTDKTDVASIVVESKAYEYTRLVLTMQNDANDNIELRTGGKKIIVGDGFGNSANTFTFPNKNGILATLDDIKSEVDNAGQKFTPRGPDKDVLKFSDDKTELYTTYSTTKDGQTDVGTAIAVGGILKNSVLQNLSVSDVFDRLFGLVERRTYDTPVLTNLQYTDVEKPTIPGEDLKATGFSFKLDGKDGFKDFISTSYYMLDGVRHDLTRDELNSINTKGETTIINFATPYTNQAKEGEKKTVTLLLHLDYNLYYTNNKEQQDFKAASLESTVDISDDSKVDFTWPNVAYADLPDNNYITGISSLNAESNFVLSTKKGSTTGTITSQSEDFNPTITSLKCIILRKGYNYSLPTVNYLAVSETDVKHQYTKNYSTTRKYLVYVTFDDFPSSLYAVLPLDGVEVSEIISNNNRLGDGTHNGFMLKGSSKSGKYSTKMADTSFQLSVTEDTVLYSLDGNTPSGYESFKYPSASSGKKNGKKVILKYNGVNVADKTYSNEVVYFKDFPESFVMHVNNTDTIDFNSITSEYNNNFYITKNNVKTELLRKSSSNNPDTTLREIPVCFSTKQYGYGSINTTNIEFEAIPLTQNNKNWDVSLIYNGDTLETKTYKGSLYYPALFMGYTKRNNCLKYKSATVPTISYNGSVVYNNLESIENDSKGNLNATKFLPNGELYDVKLSGETGDTRNFVVISTKAIQKDSEGNYLVKQDGKNKNDMFLDFDNVYGYQEYNMKIEALKSMVNQQSIKYNTYVSNPGIIFEGKYQFSIEFDG